MEPRKIPEPYLDLTAAFVTVVSKLVDGETKDYLAEVDRLVDGYFILVCQELEQKSPEVMTPSFLRHLIRRLSKNFGKLKIMAGVDDVIDMSFDRFDETLWSRISTLFPEGQTLPSPQHNDMLLYAMMKALVQSKTGFFDFSSAETLRHDVSRAIQGADGSFMSEVMIDYATRFISVAEQRYDPSDFQAMGRIADMKTYLVADGTCLAESRSTANSLVARLDRLVERSPSSSRMLH